MVGFTLFIPETRFPAVIVAVMSDSHLLNENL